MRILVVEDDADVRSALKSCLESAAYAVDVTDNANEGFYLARLNEYDLLIVDYILPGQTGLDLCRGLRAEGKTMPILILSVKSSIPDKVLLLEHGADDYLTKPFSFEELKARAKALVRRPKKLRSSVVTIGDLTIDSTRQVVTCKSKDIYMTRKEYSLLEYMAHHQGSVVSRADLMEHVWSMERDLFSNTIESHILNLRKKFARETDQKLIYTIPGRGYRLGGG